jgi:hypothetical protein
MSLDDKHSDSTLFYVGDTEMTPETSAKTSESTNEIKRSVLKEIRAKWSKFSEGEVAALKGSNDLVTQLVAKYSLEKAQAQRDVDALLKGRHIWG